MTEIKKILDTSNYLKNTIAELKSFYIIVLPFPKYSLA
jgi:hypothetical protein